MASRKCTIVNQKGLHARAAAEVVKLAERFDATITLSLDGNQAAADSLIHLLTLAAYQGKTIELIAQGNEEEQALDALENLINQRFFESS